MSEHTLLFLRLISKYDFGSVKLPELSRNGPLVCLTACDLYLFLNHRIPGLYIYSRCLPGAFSQYVFSKENSHRVTVPFLGKRRYLDILRVKGVEVGKQFLRMGYFFALVPLSTRKIGSPRN